ncbi:baseplate J/gp47 family protein [Gimesia fumaroli]|uniref:Baseplate J-like protein n=1 Tax=Gimesia fumaroli TaxID=2527976 RepID=A0A518IA14_9PLAN|nr:baseplate J/gp47 family protein [Gimesia fumaroli]QDV49900.1 Baseplate J-like protein [Gimesia fumaroli]
MKSPRAPRIDDRRQSEFLAELRRRAQVWVPDWGLEGGEQDFGIALLEVAARFDSEVTQRLDQAGDKMLRGFLDWLGIQRKAAQAARVPVVFKTATGTQDLVLATAPITLQADVDGTPVVFETETQLNIVPGLLDVVVGVDVEKDAFYLPAPGLTEVEPLSSMSTQWKLKSFAAANQNKLQLETDSGLTEGMIIAAGKNEYRVIEVENGIATVEPDLQGGLIKSEIVRQVKTFQPFDGYARNRQEHVLYLGHRELLNIDSAVTIEVRGAGALSNGFKWEYWGKTKEDEETKWQPIEVNPEDQKAGMTVLTKGKGTIEPFKIGHTESRWIRARTKKVEGSKPKLQVEELTLKINSISTGFPDSGEDDLPDKQAFANNTPLVHDNVFYPLGRDPKLFDAFYIGCEEAFSKKKADVQVCMQLAATNFPAGLAHLRVEINGEGSEILAGSASDRGLHLFKFNSEQDELEYWTKPKLLRPPSPNSDSADADRSLVTLDEPRFRVPIWKNGGDVFVAVAAGNEVWLWKQDITTPSQCGWQSLGELPESTDEDIITGLVYLETPSHSRLFALCSGKLFKCDPTLKTKIWKELETNETIDANDKLVKLTRIEPIRVEIDNKLSQGSLEQGLIGVADKGLYRIHVADNQDLVKCISLLGNEVSQKHSPVAVFIPKKGQIGGHLIAVAVGKDKDKLFAVKYEDENSGPPDNTKLDLDSRVVGSSIDANFMGESLQVAVSVKKSTSNISELVMWEPFTSDPLRRDLSAVGFTPIGAPSLLTGHVVVPTTQNQIIATKIGFLAKLQSAIITSTEQIQETQPTENKVYKVAIPTGKKPPYQLTPLDLGAGKKDEAGRTLFEFDFPSVEGEVFIFSEGLNNYQGEINSKKELLIDKTDTTTTIDSVLLIIMDSTNFLARVKDFDDERKKVTFDESLNQLENESIPTEGTAVSYKTNRIFGEPQYVTFLHKGGKSITLEQNSTVGVGSFLRISYRDRSVLRKVTNIRNGGDYADFSPVSNDQIPKIACTYQKLKEDQIALVEGENNEIKLHQDDISTKVGTFLRITTETSSGTYQVISMRGNSNEPRIAKLNIQEKDNILKFQELEDVAYQAVISTLPLLKLDEKLKTSHADLAARGLTFLGADPQTIKGEVFKVDDTDPDQSELVILERHWEKAPKIIKEENDSLVNYLTVNSINDWTVSLINTDTNPVLSWEYWNGKGWSELDGAEDGTHNLKSNGSLKFKAPDDFESSDWAGKTNFWIRGRLIGGDYGKETVSIQTTKPQKNGKNIETTQVVTRSNEDIRAPSIVKLAVVYSLSTDVQPEFVLAQDSGSVRDQSDANRTKGATVEAFVPLKLSLGRLIDDASQAAASSDEAQQADSPDHEEGAAKEEHPSEDPTQANSKEDSEQVAKGKAIFIGVEGQLRGDLVNMFMLADQQSNSAFVPLTINALVDNHFIWIAAKDNTRGLSESGLISMSFPVSPTEDELFGLKRKWLQLKPSKDNQMKDWRPKLCGAYLNSVWASARETLTRELLDSSTGEPNLTVTLARPPVLSNTLELRVRENLTEEDRKELLELGTGQVLSNVEDLPGDWVLWRCVVDPLDESAGDRVYALDENTGRIRFGDGLHGLIPPIGRDNILAFRYQRTEPNQPDEIDSPGNQVKARSELNLVSPIPSVEKVIAADDAAGGAPPESDERVMQFGLSRLRHRQRAVTLRDFKEIALQSSPEIVQAHAFQRQSSVQLIVVMRGDQPKPTAAQVRALHRTILASSSISLSAPNALAIEGPTLRRFRILLKLQVISIDAAGEVAREVKRRLHTYFDSAGGGDEGEGWPVGANPNESDISFALRDTPNLVSIINAHLVEVFNDNDDKPWPEALDGTELALLAKDSVRIQFDMVEEFK